MQLLAGSVNEEARLFVYSGFGSSLSKLARAVAASPDRHGHGGTGRVEYWAVIAFNFLKHYFGVLDLYPSVEGDNRDVSAARRRPRASQRHGTVHRF